MNRGFRASGFQSPGRRMVDQEGLAEFAAELEAWRAEDLVEGLKVGARFHHTHLIQGSPKAGTARPDICTVSRITADQVYYRTETGMKMRRDRERFLADSVKRWL